MSKPKITHREFLIARAFLKRIGGNVQNTYLLLAIVAWTRAMGKAHDAFWSSLKHASASAAGERLAKRLLAKAGAGKYAGEYKAIIKRLRQQLGGSSKKAGAAQASQAADFLLGIERSHYDKSHYGKQDFVAGHYVTTSRPLPNGTTQYETVWVPDVAAADPLWDAYAKLTDHPGIPDSWWVTTTHTTITKTEPPRPHQPRSLLHVLPSVGYIQPYAASIFYSAKPHYGDNLLLDD